jgi:hypothetical protein
MRDMTDEEMDAADPFADYPPRPDMRTQREKTAARIAKMRAAKNLRALTLNLPAELVDAFHERRKEQGKTANEVIAHLLRTQYLRKR